MGTRIRTTWFWLNLNRTVVENTTGEKKKNFQVL